MKNENERQIKNIGQLIKHYREKKGFTQKELCDFLGYTNPQFLSLIENGHSKLPLNVISKLISVLNIPEKKVVDCLLNSYHDEISQALQKEKKLHNHGR